MPPILKKIIAVLILLIVLNAGFVWYGQASFDATFQQLAKAFADNNATLPRRSALPAPITRYLEQSALSDHPYRTLVLEFEGTFRKKPESHPMPMHALSLLRPTPDMLQAERLRANAVVTFNALESYHAARAKLEALLFGIISTGEFRSEAFARSELARILAYGLFNPALLSCACIDYRDTDKHHIEATIRDGNLTATVRFILNDTGDIIAVESDDRVRPRKGKLLPARWRLDILSFGNQDGLRMPVEAEESWITEGGAFTFARYRITSAKRL